MNVEFLCHGDGVSLIFMLTKISWSISFFFFNFESESFKILLEQSYVDRINPKKNSIRLEKETSVTMQKDGENNEAFYFFDALRPAPAFTLK